MLGIDKIIYVKSAGSYRPRLRSRWEEGSENPDEGLQKEGHASLRAWRVPTVGARKKRLTQDLETSELHRQDYCKRKTT